MKKRQLSSKKIVHRRSLEVDVGYNINPAKKGSVNERLTRGVGNWRVS